MFESKFERTLVRGGLQRYEKRRLLINLILSLDLCIVILYGIHVIKSFRHKGLEKFFQTGSKAGIHPSHAEKLRDRLLVLNNASAPSDMAIPGWDFHALSHDMKGHYAVKVDRMWRLTFTFEGTDAILVDYQDYR